MTIQQQLIFLFSALGAFNGSVLSGYFLVVKREKRLSDRFLGGLLLMLSIRIFKSVFLFFNPSLFQLFVQIGLSACILIGPFLYLYVVSMVKENHTLLKTWWLYLIPFVVVIAWLAYDYPYYGKPNIWGPFVGYMYKLWMVCIIAAGYDLRGVFKKLLDAQKKIPDHEVWLLTIYVGVSVIYLAYETSNYTSYIVGALSFSFVFYISVMLYIFKNKHKPIASDPVIKYANSHLAVEDAEAHMKQISDVMTEEKLYLDPELTLSNLSKKLGIGTKELSQSINQTTDANYSKYISNLRVGEAKRLLIAEDRKNYKIASIAYESGFNSLSSFNTVFKQLTGTTPIAYQKAHQVIN